MPMHASHATGIIYFTVFNLIWWSLRILGLRPFLLPALRSRTAPSHQRQPKPTSSGAPRPATNP
jgi:hypothetical protein